MFEPDDPVAGAGHLRRVGGVMTARDLADLAFRFTPPGGQVGADVAPPNGGSNGTPRGVRTHPHPVATRQPPPWALRLMRSTVPRRVVTLLLALACLGLIVAVAGVRVARG